MPDLRVLPTRLARNAVRRTGRRLVQNSPGVRLRQAALVETLPGSKAAPEIKRPYTKAPVACFDQPIKGIVITVFSAATGTC